MPNSSSPYPDSDREILRLIERSPSHRAGYKQLVRELGLGGGRERRLLLEQLTRMALRNELIHLDNGQWSLPHATPDRTARAPRIADVPDPQRTTRDHLVAGKLDLHRDGFGFVRPNGSTSREDDLFIPPNELNGAMQGDEVLVDEAPPGRPGPDGKARRSGRVLRILTRRNLTVVGIFHYAHPHGRRGHDQLPDATARFNFVTPLDERMTQPILIPDGPDGQPILPPAQTENRTIGEEARRTVVLPETYDPLEGLAVDIEITEFPTLAKPARGRILEILGHPDDFGVDVEIVIRKHHLPYQFPANVLTEADDSAHQTVDTLPNADSATRRDFRQLPIATIDGETARDFDDAVLVTALPNGHTELQVHIADVSHYVRPGTALDLEARLRGTSVYFPDRAVPMLPPALSSGICSLRPDEDRLVLSCIAEIDPQGEVVAFEVCEGIIRSHARLSYTVVQHLIDDTANDALAPEYQRFLQQDRAEYKPRIDQMHALALLLNQKRQRRGSIDFDLPEPVVQFDPQGNMAAITKSERGWAHRLIEEFMLTANECVAHWLEALTATGSSIDASIYRIHEIPDPKRLLDFEEVASTYGHSLGFSSMPIKKFTMKSDRRGFRAQADRHGTRARTAQSHEVPEAIPITPQQYQRLTARIAGTPEERILAYLMLRSLKQARYSEKNEGHFALASPSYTHFTSPIRRYPDLIVHRLVRAALHAGANPHGAPILSTDPQPWSTSSASQKARHPERSAQCEVEGPRRSTPLHNRSNHSATEAASSPATTTDLPEPELAAIARESSEAERRADEAERELMEWKKIKFMQDRIGEEFSATVLSCTKYGFFVELDDLFIEGLVPIATLAQSLPFGEEDRFFFRDTDRTIVGQFTGKVFRLGLRVHVLLDRIDRPARRLQFALVPEPAAPATPRPPRQPKLPKPATQDRQATEHPSPNRSGKPLTSKPPKRKRR